MATPKPYRDGWRIQVQKDGHRVSKTFKLKRDAQLWAIEQKIQTKPRNSPSLREGADKYLETLTPQKRDAIDWDTSRFEELCAYEDPELGLFGDCPMGDIDSAALGRWRDFKLKSVTGSTVVRYVNLYRNLFIVAWKEWKWIDANPWIGVWLPDENDSRDKVWRWQDIRRVLREGQRRGGKQLEVVQAFHIALHTALRLQEALAAPANFNKVTGVITLPTSKTQKTAVRVPTYKRARRIIQATPIPTVEANEASTLFSKLLAEMMIKGMQFRDSRATALTLLSRKVDILTLVRISRHKNMELLRKTYYRETAEEISARLQPKKETKVEWSD